MKEKTRLLISAAQHRNREMPRKAAGILYGKVAKKFQRGLTKRRTTVANKFREIRKTHGHELARVYARARS
jgi:hypothetical protein